MTEYEPTIIVTENGKDFAETAAKILWEAFEKNSKALVSLPTGSTPLDIYSTLLRDHGDRKDVWSQIHYVSLDDYVGLADDDTRLFKNWLAREILDPAGVTNRTTFNSRAADTAAEAQKMEQFLRDHGGLDIAVLGLGTNGHLAFNEPGSRFDSETRTMPLSEETREANAKYWDGSQDVPERAFTLGLKTITSAKQIFLLVSGAHKAQALDAALNGVITEDLPASILRKVPNVTIIADKAAMGR